MVPSRKSVRQLWRKEALQATLMALNARPRLRMLIWDDGRVICLMSLASTVSTLYSVDKILQLATASLFRATPSVRAAASPTANTTEEALSKWLPVKHLIRQQCCALVLKRGWRGDLMWLKSGNHAQANTEMYVGTLEHLAAAGSGVVLSATCPVWHCRSCCRPRS